MEEFYKNENARFYAQIIPEHEAISSKHMNHQFCYKK